MAILFTENHGQSLVLLLSIHLTSSRKLTRRRRDFSLRILHDFNIFLCCFVSVKFSWRRAIFPSLLPFSGPAAALKTCPPHLVKGFQVISRFDGFNTLQQYSYSICPSALRNFYISNVKYNTLKFYLIFPETS